MGLPLNATAIIRRKRDGLALTDAEIEGFIKAATQRKIPDYQITAFLMATFFQGMNVSESAALTRAMIGSGRRIEFDGAASSPSAEPKVYVDKHSTGGIGDKISLVLAPLVAALGLPVPMVAGRGLGHTGGTLDKLESIPGFNVNLKIEDFKHQVQTVGTAIMGQTGDFVPADKLLYSLRDVTATVECIPLITASILSKKVAEGISGLVLDIKVGNGAFMKTMSDAQALAKSLMTVGKALGIQVRALLTDMNQPLGYAIGNSLEVLECLDVLENRTGSSHWGPGHNPQDIKDLTVELAAHMLVVGEATSSLSAGRLMARRALQDGSALAKFREMCKAQGAKRDITSHRDALKIAEHSIEVTSPRAGFVTKYDGETLGLLVVDLGGGRHTAEDSVDHSVGIVLHAKHGAAVKKGMSLMTIYYDPERLATLGLSTESVRAQALSTVSLAGTKPKSLTLIKKVMQ